MISNVSLETNDIPSKTIPDLPAHISDLPGDVKAIERLNLTFGEVVQTHRELGLKRFPAHVVDVIGADLPWGSWGSVAIQSFRTKPFVYFIGGDIGLVKIGHSVAPLERLASMQMGSPVDLSILALTPGGADLEKSYHYKFSTARRRGEWFARTPEICAEIERIKEDAHV